MVSGLISSPHKQTDRSVSDIMKMVLMALIPGTLAYIYFFGISILINICIAIVFSLLAEAFVVKLRKRPILPVIGDYSSVVSAWLFALAIPPLSPWWLTALGIVLAIIFAKQLFGGLGYNPFNPAMIGYVVLLISYPKYMTAWIAPEQIAQIALSSKDIFAIIFSGDLPANLTLDSITSATPLDSIKNGLIQNKTIGDIQASPIFGHYGGLGWEWIAGMYFVGGLWLIYKKVIRWCIPVSLLGTILILGGIFFVIDPTTYPSPLFHIFSGGLMLGAFFIATDPVATPSSIKGKVLFAVGVGVITYCIRSFGGYPDGVAFAVLIMNMFSPTIDYFIRPRVFGAQSKED